MEEKLQCVEKWHFLKNNANQALKSIYQVNKVLNVITLKMKNKDIKAGKQRAILKIGTNYKYTIKGKHIPFRSIILNLAKEEAKIYPACLHKILEQKLYALV